MTAASDIRRPTRRRVTHGGPSPPLALPQGYGRWVRPSQRPRLIRREAAYALPITAVIGRSFWVVGSA